MKNAQKTLPPSQELLNLSTVENLKRKRIIEVLVTYADHSPKLFSLEDWVIFREGIIKNLYDRNLCNIDFIEV